MISLTRGLEAFLQSTLPGDTSLDEEFKTHCLYVGNQILQTIRKEGPTSQAFEVCGKLGWRLFNVYQAYKSKRRRVSLDQWIEEVQEIGKELAGAYLKGR